MEWEFTRVTAGDGSDTGGVLSALGTSLGKRPYQNPVASGAVELRCSPQCVRCDCTRGKQCKVAAEQPAAAAAAEKEGVWFVLDLRGRLLAPTHYCYRGDLADDINPRSWTLQASADGSSWTTLRRHVDEIFALDPSVTDDSCGAWPIEGGEHGAGFSQFRIVHAGAPERLCCAGFELFGSVAGVVRAPPPQPGSPESQPATSRSSASRVAAARLHRASRRSESFARQPAAAARAAEAPAAIAKPVKAGARTAASENRQGEAGKGKGEGEEEEEDEEEDDEDENDEKEDIEEVTPSGNAPRDTRPLSARGGKGGGVASRLALIARVVPQGGVSVPLGSTGWAKPSPKGVDFSSAGGGKQPKWPVGNLEVSHAILGNSVVTPTGHMLTVAHHSSP